MDSFGVLETLPRTALLIENLLSQLSGSFLVSVVGKKGNAWRKKKKGYVDLHKS